MAQSRWLSFLSKNFWLCSQAKWVYFFRHSFGWIEFTFSALGWNFLFPLEFYRSKQSVTSSFVYTFCLPNDTRMFPMLIKHFTESATFKRRCAVCQRRRRRRHRLRCRAWRQNACNFGIQLQMPGLIYYSLANDIEFDVNKVQLSCFDLSHQRHTIKRFANESVFCLFFFLRLWKIEFGQMFHLSCDSPAHRLSCQVVFNVRRTHMISWASEPTWRRLRTTTSATVAEANRFKWTRIKFRCHFRKSLSNKSNFNISFCSRSPFAIGISNEANKVQRNTTETIWTLINCNGNEFHFDVSLFRLCSSLFTLRQWLFRRLTIKILIDLLSWPSFYFVSCSHFECWMCARSTHSI